MDDASRTYNLQILLMLKHINRTYNLQNLLMLKHIDRTYNLQTLLRPNINRKKTYKLKKIKCTKH